MPRPIPKQPPAIPFTQAAYDQMQQDFDRLTKTRKEVLVRLQAAREMGDLSENGAYTYAKLELGTVSRQLRELKYLLEYGKVTQASSNQTVGFGNTVTLKTSKGKEIVYTMVSIHESDLLAHKLSTESPLGAAIMNQPIGKVVTVVAPAGETKYEILKIE